MKKDNLISSIAFTKEMLVKQCLDNAAEQLGITEDVLVLIRNTDGDILLFHSFDERAKLVDIMEECKYATYSGDFFDV